MSGRIQFIAALAMTSAIAFSVAAQSGTHWDGATVQQIDDRPRSGEVIAEAICDSMDYHGGGVLDHVKIQHLFWGGTYWNNAAAGGGAQFRTQIDSAWSYIGNNAGFYSVLKEYGTPNQTMGEGSFLGSVLNNLDPPASVNEQSIQDMLSTALFFGLVPPNMDWNMLYVVYLPAGTVSQLDQTNGWGGHHGSFTYAGNNQRVFYAVITPQGTLDQFTLIASHEVDEAVVDPNINQTQGWDEVGDLCQYGAARGYRFSGYLVEKIWSRVNCRCESPEPVLPSTSDRLKNKRCAACLVP